MIKGRIGKVLSRYINENMSVLFFIFIIFLIGIIAGAVTVNILNSDQKGELYSYINGFLESKDKVSQGELFVQILVNHIKLVLTLWFLGVTVVGIPLIFGLVGFKGFTIGFTVGFMLDVFTDLRGILIIVSSIVPQALIILPCIIVLSIKGIRLSLYLLKGGEPKKNKGSDIKLKLIMHTVTSIFVLGIIALGALLESFMMPLFLNIIYSSYYSSI